ncbi:MAG: hypothetical protein AB7G47_04405 [Mycolicibacterium sp.]|uniref:hypothetical protein n=1 Tax=Mycolicibacterium sp. TaxID=2320850 RepID=UPI003D10EAC8
MSNSSPGGPFGFDPDDFDFDRVVRDAGEGLREALDGLSRFMGNSGRRGGWSAFLDDFTQATRGRAQPETTGDTGDGVWVIYTVDAEGGAQVEQVYPTELEALRANRTNTDPSRLVRFLPYGIATSVLDEPEAGEGARP